MKHRYFEIRAQSAGEATVYLYEPIGDDPLGDGTGARDFAEQIEALGEVDKIIVRINSPGGSVFEGLAIYNTLAQHPATVETHVDGLAASIASLIAMAGDTVAMAENALMMIHDPHGLVIGNAEDARRFADALDKIKDAMLNSYARQTGKPRDEIAQLMSDETWLTAEEALELGFVDSIEEPLKVAASFDLSHFQHPPSSLAGETMKPKSKPDALALERERRSQIREVFSLSSFATDYRGLLDACLDDTQCTVAQAREKLLNAIGEGQEPLGQDPADLTLSAYPGTGGEQEFRAAAVDAMLIRNGVRVADAHPGARDLRGLSVVALAETCLSRRGKAGDWMGKGGKAAIIKAALSTSDLPALLADTARKAAMIGFRNEEAVTHRVWTRESDLPDFKTASRVALSEAPGLLKVPEGGEYQHGALDDAKETIKLDTYGRIVSLTRHAMINDDLGELTRLPEAMGLAAARRESDLVYGLINTNPTMRDGTALFHANHGNLAGTGAAPSIATLGSARAAMRVQKGLKGESYLGVRPVYFLVPVALETSAQQLIVQITPAKTADVAPEWMRQLIVIADPRLDDNSATAWYLAASPAAFDTIEVARLDGEQPSVEEDTDFDTDNVRFKVRIDTGAAAIDWRALYKNPGA